MATSFPFLPDGKELTLQPPERVEEFLLTRKTEWIDCLAAECQIEKNDSRFLLRTENGRGGTWPIRRTFFEKLLRWHSIPPGPLYRMDPDCLVPFLNGALKLIRGNVRIRLENGEALTIASERYFPVNDLDLLNRFKGHPVSGVSRTDFHMRIYFVDRTRFEPVVNDPCGLGYHVFNSETGFMALLACTFIMRYSCGNGAVREHNFGDATAPLYHYNITDELVETYLTTAMRDIEKNLPLLKELLTNSVKKPAPPKTRIAKELGAVLGYQNGEKLLEDFREGPHRTLYDLFNHITAKAKHYEPNKKVFLEKYAGKLLSWDPSFSRRTTNDHQDD